MKIINENGDADFEFTSALMKLLGISEEEVSDVIENLEVDDLTGLVDACVRGDAEAARQIVGTETEGESHEDEPKLSDHELMAQKLFSPKDKAKARKSKEASILRKSETELGEDTNSDRSFNIGDPCAVDGEEGTIKIASAPGDTVGVMINGELKMVDKKNVHKLEEGVLGMTGMPGLKPNANSDLQRIRELAGLRDEGSFDEPEPAEFPNQPPMTPPMETPPAQLGMGDDMDMGHDDSMGAMDAPMDAPMAGSMDGAGEAPMAPEMGMPELPAPDAGMPMPGSALEDAAALDQAISEIENLIPNVKISEYKTLVARLKALVSMAESAGKAALTEGRTIHQRQGREYDPSKKYDHQVTPRRLSDPTPDDHDVAPYRGRGMEEDGPAVSSLKGTPAPEKNSLKAKISSYAAARRNEDRLAPKGEKVSTKVGEPTDDADVTRKTLMDYVREADEGMETIGMDRNAALKAFQARMGPNTSPQQANSAFDAMFASGKVKQQNGAFQMPAMSDEDFHTAMAQTGPSTAPTNGASANPAPTDQQGKGVTGQTPGQNTSNPGANVQGSSNSAYQGR